MATNSLAAKAPALAARTVHLKLFPTPRNFTEQREVLRVLERFGEVTMFKSLKYRALSPVHNAFIATFANEASVVEVRNAAPIRYFLVPEANTTSTPTTAQTPTEPPVEDTATYKPLSPSSSPPPINAEFDRTSNENTPVFSAFHLEIYPSNLQHDKYITSPHTNPLYGPYPPLPPSRSLIAGMLKDNVASTMWAKGLRDWETDAERWRVASGGENEIVGDGDGEGLKGKVLGAVGGWSDRGEEEEMGGSGVPGLERAAYIRAVNRRRHAIPSVMWGLRRFKEEAEREGEREREREVLQQRNGID